MWLAEYCLRGLAGAALLALVHVGAHAQRGEPATQQPWVGETGTASYYGRAHQGRRTAGGGNFDQRALTGAHPWLPFGTKVMFRYRARTVTAVVDDRGPFVSGRDWDLNQNTAAALGFGGVGTVWVTQ